MERKRNVLKKLREWRDNEAKRSGVELFRVLSNDAVNGIAESLPSTKEALMEVQGIADKKFPFPQLGSRIRSVPSRMAQWVK